jgi:hypothetical protein
VEFLISFLKRNNMNVTSALSSVGAIGGIYYGVSQKKSFWTTIGFTILFSIGGAEIGTTINAIKN